MTFSEIERLVAQMEAACNALFDSPADHALRTNLHGVLAAALDDFVPDAGIEGGGDAKLLYGMMRQTSAYARIMRSRIETVWAGRISESFAKDHLLAALRDLQWILSQLRRHLDVGA